jgi:RNase P subunit RPR2
MYFTMNILCPKCEGADWKARCWQGQLNGEGNQEYVYLTCADCGHVHKFKSKMEYQDTGPMMFEETNTKGPKRKWKMELTGDQITLQPKK